MRWFLTASLLLALACTASCGRDAGWASVKKTIRARYPDVRHISTDSLARRLAQGPQPLLLDVRTPEEFAVSHLRGARRIDPEDETLTALTDVAPGTPIVTYCSVGYRSAALAQRLVAAGYTDVVNLEGSIFAWANEGRPVYRGGRVVREVHPYDRLWGRLLDRSLHAQAF